MEEIIVEFKNLEKLCNELYGAPHGVTLYINEMQQQPEYSVQSVPGWYSDLAGLRRVRHIRNILVHEPDYDIQYSGSDIEFIRDFCQRILYRQDPLALLRQQAERIPQMRTQQQATQFVSQPSADADEGSIADGSFGKWLLAGIIIAVLIALLRSIG